MFWVRNLHPEGAKTAMLISHSRSTYLIVGLSDDGTYGLNSGGDSAILLPIVIWLLYTCNIFLKDAKSLEIL